jgi:hypothetical protein
MGFSNLDKVGVLTEGFDQLGTMTWYNYPYYATHFEQLGYKMEKNMSKVNFLFKRKTSFRANELVKKRYQLHSILRQPKRLC